MYPATRHPLPARPSVSQPLHTHDSRRGSACIDEWVLKKRPVAAGEATSTKLKPSCPLCKADPFQDVRGEMHAVEDQEAIMVTRM